MTDLTFALSFKDARENLGDVLLTFAYHPGGFEVQVHDFSFGDDHIRYAALIPFQAAYELSGRIKSDKGILVYSAWNREQLVQLWSQAARKAGTHD